MSTCPERELLCVYIDGELPEKYSEKLKAHIAECESCKRHLAQLQSIQAALQTDAQSKSFSDTALDESFTRLKTKQKYRNVALRSDRRVASSKPGSWFGLGALAAAAILALILPVKVQQQTSVSGIQLTQNSKTPVLIHERGIASDNSETLAAFASYNRNTSENPTVTVNLSQANLAALATLANVDIFRPVFSEKNITITINLETVPGILPEDATYWQKAGAVPVSFSQNRTPVDYQ